MNSAKRPLVVWIGLFLLVLYIGLHLLAAYAELYEMETSEIASAEGTRAVYFNALISLVMLITVMGVFLRYAWGRWLTIAVCGAVFVYYTVTAIRNSLIGDPDSSPTDPLEWVGFVTAFFIILGPLAAISLIFAFGRRVRDYFSPSDEVAPSHKVGPPPPPRFDL